MALDTPIVFIVFNRPRHTRKSFEAIRFQRPKQLFIVADGPRKAHPTDDENCLQVREIVAKIDWPCDVHRNYVEQNLGCKQRVNSGLDWVFTLVERAIILEDDCLPNPDFFSFCETLLERYQDNEQIMTITGNNFQNGHQRGDADYYFSKYAITGEVLVLTVKLKTNQILSGKLIYSLISGEQCDNANLPCTPYFNSALKEYRLNNWWLMYSVK